MGEGYEMNDRHKFRVWNKVKRCFFLWDISMGFKGTDEVWEDQEQCTGLKDNTGARLWYDGDIGRFDNGDKFVIRMEEWTEFYVDWIGDPECEDQARDFYRIRNAEIIGNIHENPELLESTS
jgi:hypothetical protein